MMTLKLAAWLGIAITGVGVLVSGHNFVNILVDRRNLLALRQNGILRLVINHSVSMQGRRFVSLLMLLIYMITLLVDPPANSLLLYNWGTIIRICTPAVVSLMLTLNSASEFWHEQAVRSHIEETENAAAVMHTAVGEAVEAVTDKVTDKAVEKAKDAIALLAEQFDAIARRPAADKEATDKAAAKTAETVTVTATAITSLQETGEDTNERVKKIEQQVDQA